MSNHNLKLISLIVGSFVLTIAFQNCSQIKPGLNVTDYSSQDDIGAIISDDDGNVVDVIPVPPNDEKPPEVIIQPTPVDNTNPDIVVIPDPVNEPKEPQKEKPPVSEHEDESCDDQKEEKELSCVELARQDIKNSIDISKINSLHKLTILKDKKFIYSSKGMAYLNQIEVRSSCHEIVFCDVKVRKINKNRNKIKLIRSHIEEDENGSQVQLTSQHHHHSEHQQNEHRNRRCRSLGQYKGYRIENGVETLFISTDSISESEALANCKLNMSNNPHMQIKCTWKNSAGYIKTILRSSDNHHH